VAVSRAHTQAFGENLPMVRHYWLTASKDIAANLSLAMFRGEPRHCYTVEMSPLTLTRNLLLIPVLWSAGKTGPF